MNNEILKWMDYESIVKAKTVITDFLAQGKRLEESILKLTMNLSKMYSPKIQNSVFG